MAYENKFCVDDTCRIDKDLWWNKYLMQKIADKKVDTIYVIVSPGFAAGHHMVHNMKLENFL